jgi:hypothetical protein
MSASADQCCLRSKQSLRASDVHREVSTQTLTLLGQGEPVRTIANTAQRPSAAVSPQRAGLRVRAWQQTVGFPLHHGITLATKPLQLWSIKHCDPAARIADDSELL